MALRAWRRIAAHRGEATIVGLFLVVVAVVADLTGAAARYGRIIAGAGVVGGLVAAFGAVWLPIAVIDFRRCTRETALRARVEADLAKQTEQVQARDRAIAMARTRCTDVLSRGGPSMVFQPIMDIAEERAVGYEALSRFADGRGPEAWFSEAAGAGVGIELELAAIATALRCLPQLPDGVYMSVNASPGTLLDRRLADMVAGCAAGLVVVELTEHDPLEEYDRFLVAVERLRSLGARLAIDDAGAGYASFRHVVALAPEIIKVDRSLVRNAHVDRTQRSLLRAFAAVAADIGASLVAEGVECAEEEATLRTLGVPFAQGWHYQMPAPLPVVLAERMDRPATLGAR